MIELPQLVTVRVPATSANLGPGYDCLGIALTLYNTVQLSVDGELQPYRPETQIPVIIQVSGVDAEKIPTDVSNLVYQTAALIFERAGLWPAALTIKLNGEIPVGSGLGSSSAAVVAGLLAANAMTGNQISFHDLLHLAATVEGHPDNVAPAMLGGLVLGIMTESDGGSQALTLERLSTPPLHAVVALPNLHFPTSAARTVVPRAIERQDAIHNAARMGLLVHALTTGNYGYLRTAMDDRLHQPYRLPLIPGAAEAMTAAYKAGAAGVALSGAGPSLIAFSPDHHARIAEAMVDSFAAAGLLSRVWTLQVEPQGAHVIVPSQAVD